MDQYPQIFNQSLSRDQNKKSLNLNPEELELLRAIVVGDRKLFGSRSAGKMK
jgi:hypothetical protein